MTLNRQSERISRARLLRRNMNEGEKRLWAELKQFRTRYGIHFRRQAPIGPYVVDFVSLRHRLIVELDGDHHFTAQAMKKDAARDARLSKLGYRIHRINTGELAGNMDGCIDTLLREIGTP